MTELIELLLRKAMDGDKAVLFAVEQVVDRYSLMDRLFYAPFYLCLDNNRTGNHVDNQPDVPAEA